jgi:methionyl-tRNA formyltransferase
MPPLRLVFLGSDPIALPLLDWLAGPGAAAAEVVGVFTQPDRPAGRGQQVRPNAIKAWAEARGLPVRQPERLTPEVTGALAELRPDLGLVMAYGHLLRDDFLGVPRLGMLNLHTSLLPALRGASPIQTAVALGWRETGVSLMRIVRRLDAGPVADQERVPIGSLDTALELEERLAAACVPLVARSLPALARGELAFAAQDEAAVTHCRKLTKEDGALDFTRPAAELAARINGLFPWPGCSAALGGEALKVGLADVPDAAPPGGAGTPGQVAGSDAAGLLVWTGAGCLRLRRLQRPGGRMLPAAEFLRGFPVPPGAIFASRPMPGLLVPPRPPAPAAAH